MEQASVRNDLRQLYGTLRQVRADPNIRSSLVKDNNNNILTSEDDCLRRWKEHFEALLSHPPVPEDLGPEVDENNNDPNPDCSTELVTVAEVRAALKKLKAYKAPGICSITAEMLKSGGDNIILWLTHIINHVWVQERLPDDWRRGIILPFWKRKGDRMICSNHRGITLLSIPGKIFTRILLTRALPAIRSCRRPQQAGFMPGRSTIDHISAVRLMVEKAYEFRSGRQMYLAFIDLRAAFDSVDHRSLWKIVERLGTPPKLVNLFRQLYSDAESCVRVNGNTTDWFKITSGVRQGCMAAPDLFNCIIDHLMQKVSHRFNDFNFGKFPLNDHDMQTTLS